MDDVPPIRNASRLEPKYSRDGSRTDGLPQIQGLEAVRSARPPFPANLGAVATIVAGTSGLVSAIEGVSLGGQAHDDSSSILSDGTWYLQGSERVVDRPANKDLTRYLNQATQTTNRSNANSVESAIIPTCKNSELE